MNKINLDDVYVKINNPKFKGTFKIDGYIVDDHYGTTTVWISKDTSRTFKNDEVIIFIKEDKQMVKVIETNLSIDGNDNIKDHQSRVIEVESWDGYIEEIRNRETITREACIGGMYGCTIPRSATIENLISDEIHLLCDVYNYMKSKTKKLAYLIRED